MRGLFLLFLFAAAVNCNAQLSADFYTSKSPDTPLRVTLDTWCTHSLDSIKRQLGKQTTYYHKGKLFTGWACSIDMNTEHRYRYAKFEDGLLVWQLGYFASGNIGHDFRRKGDKSMGSERMWKADGSLYIKGFYSAPGVFDGLQERWYSNGQKASESLYQHGRMLYMVEWSTNGWMVKAKGNVPQTYRGR